MATSTTVTDLNGLFKQVYGDKIVNLLPEFSIVTRESKFVKNDQRNGSYYNQPVIVQGEQGVTYAAAGAGAFDLNPSSTMVMQNAQLLGGQIMFKAALDNESAARAVKGGASAFESATKLQTTNVLESHGKRVELALLYGQTNLGHATSTAAVNSTTRDINFSTATWSDALWSGMTGAKISIFEEDGTILNANAALVITRVNTAAKQLRVTGNSADITAVAGHVGVGSPAGVGLVNFYGARETANVYKEAAGIDKILTNTGDLFGISAATYDLWKANSFSAGGATLTQGKLDAAVAIAVGKGLSGKISTLVNPKTWVTLNSDQAAKRVYDSSYDSAAAKNGFKKITYLSQNGEIDIISHPFVKEGEAFLVPFDECVRPGSTDVTFNIPGQEGGEIFTPMENAAGFFYKSYSNQAFLINTPAQTVKITDIVNA